MGLGMLKNFSVYINGSCFLVLNHFGIEGVSWNQLHLQIVGETCILAAEKRFWCIVLIFIWFQICFYFSLFVVCFPSKFLDGSLSLFGSR